VVEKKLYQFYYCSDFAYTAIINNFWPDLHDRKFATRIVCQNWVTVDEDIIIMTRESIQRVQTCRRPPS